MCPGELWNTSRSESSPNPAAFYEFIFQFFCFTCISSSSALSPPLSKPATHSESSELQRCDHHMRGCLLPHWTTEGWGGGACNCHWEKMFAHVSGDEERGQSHLLTPQRSVYEACLFLFAGISPLTHTNPPPLPLSLSAGLRPLWYADVLQQKAEAHQTEAAPSGERDFHISGSFFFNFFHPSPFCAPYLFIW